MSSVNKLSNKVILACVLGFFGLLEGGGFVLHRVTTQRDIEIMPASVVSEAATKLSALDSHVMELTNEFHNLESLIQNRLQTAATERRELYQNDAALDARVNTLEKFVYD